MYEQEKAFVQAFVRREIRPRYSSLSKRNQRLKLISDINRWDFLDPRYAEKLPPEEESMDAWFAVLERFGAPDECYLISEQEDIDKCAMSLRDGLSECYKNYYHATVVICIPGKLALVHNEEVTCICARRGQETVPGTVSGGAVTPRSSGRRGRPCPEA